MELSSFISQISKKYHEIEMAKRLSCGYHAPNDCNVHTLIVNTTDQNEINAILEKLKYETRCPQCDKDLYPYEDLLTTLKTPIKDIVSNILLTVSILENTTCGGCSHWGGGMCSVVEPAVEKSDAAIICTLFDWNITTKCKNCIYWANNLCSVADPSISKDGETESCESFKWTIIAKCKECGYWGTGMCSVTEPTVAKDGESEICKSFSWVAPDI